MQMSCRPLLSAFLLVAFSLTACNLAAERSDKHGAHAITDSDNDKITFVVGSPLVPSPDIEKAQKLYEQAKELQDHDSNTAKPVELLQKAIAQKYTRSSNSALSSSEFLNNGLVNILLFETKCLPKSHIHKCWLVW